MELGAEVMYQLMQTLFAHAQEVVPQYAGTITQWGGDGFIALFGALVISFALFGSYVEGFHARFGGVETCATPCFYSHDFLFSV